MCKATLSQGEFTSLLMFEDEDTINATPVDTEQLKVFMERWELIEGPTHKGDRTISVWRKRK